MKKFILATPVLLILCIAAASCSDGFPPEFPAPEFTLKSPLTDKESSLSMLKGRPIIIYWFTSW